MTQKVPLIKLMINGEKRMIKRESVEPECSCLCSNQTRISASSISEARERILAMALKKNVGNIERAASVLIGGIALAQAIRGQRGAGFRSLAGSTGAALLWRGVSGNCPLYSSLEIDRSTQKPIKPQSTIERSAAVNKPMEEVMSFMVVPLLAFRRTEPRRPAFDGAHSASAM